MTTVAVLGTGIMGAPMTRHLAQAGFDVRAWNRTRQKAQPLADHGVQVCSSPGEAMRGADFLVTVLADADAVAECVTADGALADAAGARAAQSGSLVWVQASTVGIDGTTRLSRLAADAGARYVDAPVLGTRGPAESGQLTVLASGDEDLRELCAPLFDAYGSRTVWLGEGDRASRFKLVMNSWVLALTTATAEAMALAGGLGLDPRRFLDAIEGGPLDVGYAHVKGDMMTKQEFAPAFPAWGALKDAGLIVDAAQAAGVRMPVAVGVRTAMQATVDAGHGEEDLAAVWYAVTGDD